MAEEEKPPPEPDASLPGRAMMPPRVRFGHNAPPNDYISRDTPLVLEQTTATVPVSPTPVAGTAPSEIKATLVAAGHLVADAQTYGRGFAADTIANRRAVQALLEGTQAKIAELREERLNDPGTGELIDFLDWLAKGLSALVDCPSVATRSYRSNGKESCQDY
jgi:hypothetical protein